MDWRFIPSWTCKRQLHSLQKNVFLENTQDIVINLFPAVPAKRIDIRMHLLFVMSH